MPGGGTLLGAARGRVPGLMISTDGTGLIVGVVNDDPQLEQKVASSLFVASH